MPLLLQDWLKMCLECAQDWLKIRSVTGKRWRIGTPRSRKCLVARTPLWGSSGRRCVAPTALPSGHKLPRLAITCREHDCQYSARRPQKVSTNHARCQLRQSLLKSGFCSVAPVRYIIGCASISAYSSFFFRRKWPIITVFRANQSDGCSSRGARASLDAPISQ